MSSGIIQVSPGRIWGHLCLSNIWKSYMWIILKPSDRSSPAISYLPLTQDAREKRFPTEHDPWGLKFIICYQSVLMLHFTTGSCVYEKFQICVTFYSGHMLERLWRVSWQSHSGRPQLNLFNFLYFHDIFFYWPQGLEQCQGSQGQEKEADS